MRELELTAGSMVAGGDAIARDADGRVVFIEGALPGERVRVELTEERRDLARARVVEVLEASDLRVAPPCCGVAAGCGGCQWQHVAPAGQAVLKAGIVVDALRRIAHLHDVAVVAEPAPASGAYRTTMRLGVVNGRAGLHVRHGAEIIDLDAACTVAHPLVADVIARSDFARATEVTVRAGVATGDRLVLAKPNARGILVPDGVTLLGEDEVKHGRHAHIVEEVAGRRWRVSATSFFQSGPVAAEALVRAVRDAIGDSLGGKGRLVDAYAGVGLFAGAIGGGAGVQVVAVEQHGPAVSDARHNLRDLDVNVVRAEVARWSPPEGADVMIADPGRPGLGKKATSVLAGAKARSFVLVSCDPASMARDASLLAVAGYRLDGVTVVDTFPHTSHVETVAQFVLDRVRPSDM